MRIRPEALRTLPLACLLALAGTACGDFSGGSESGGAPQLGSFAGLPLCSTASIDAFETSVYPVLRDNCVDCHAGAGPGSPHFANANSTTACQALLGQGKVNLASPDTSRIAVKVGGNHHCWSGDCATDAATLAAAVQVWSDDVEFGEGGVAVSGALASNALSMDDGIVDTGSERYGSNLIALYEFKEGTGDLATDTSGFAPALDLELSGDVEWMSSWGVELDGGRLQADEDLSRKLYDAIADPGTGTQQFTVEAWIVPANVDQEGPARIVSYSRSTGSRNFTLGQVMYNYNARTRSLAALMTDPQNGRPDLQTADADQDAQDRLQHVVLTYDQFRGRRLFVDSVYTGDEDEVGPGRLWNWSDDHALVLGNERNGGRPWRGQLRMVAIYRQSLTDAQIRQNFEAGVGQRRLMRFDVTTWMGGPSSVDLVLTELDDYSYLFCQPTLRTGLPNGSRVANLRIAVNGVLAPTGQAFELVDEASSGTKQELSRQCAVIPKVLGPDDDEFALVFEHLGGFQNVVVEDEVPPAGIPLDPDPVPANGLRDFDRIDASFARLTGLPRSVGADTLEEAIEQLPASYDVRSFVSPHQMSMAKLALDYCEALVDSPADRAAFFPGLDFDALPGAAFDAAGQQALVDALFGVMVGADLAMQPTRAELETVLFDPDDPGDPDDPVGLVDTLTEACPDPSCDAEFTRTVVKAACTAVLSSAAVTLH